MTDESIWVALEPVATGVGWTTIAALIAYTVIGICADIARQVRDSRHRDAQQYRRRVENAQQAARPRHKDAA